MFHRLVFVVAATCAAAETPCDFKGVSVGEKTTPSSLMASLGIKNYKMNPERWQSDKFLELGKKYGLTSAAEIEEWNAGPACDSDSCRIPFGVGVGNSNSPVSVFVSFPGGRITEIDVAFNKTYWDEIRPVQYIGPRSASSSQRGRSINFAVYRTSTVVPTSALSGTDDDHVIICTCDLPPHNADPAAGLAGRYAFFPSSVSE
jgi:hypothetical protein